MALSGCADQPGVRTWATGGVTTENLAVAVNSELRVGFFIGGLLDNCTEMGKVSVRPTAEPAHGALLITEETDIPTLHLPPNDKRRECAGRKYRGVLVRYKPESGFVGDDVFGIDVIWPNGNSVKRNITVHVR